MTYLRFCGDVAHNTDLTTAFRDDDRRKNFSIHRRLSRCVEVGGENREGDVVQKRHQSVHSVVKLVVPQRLE